MKAVDVKKALYGHTSAETAYLVGDYPYGRTVRCRIRYWLEYTRGKGYRFVSQTEHPRTLAWNKPKKSTYALLSAAMYLDADGHCVWACVTEYTSAEEARDFAAAFPDLDGEARTRLIMWAARKVAFLTACLDGRAVFTINGEPRPWSDADQERHASELEVWKALMRPVGGVRQGNAPHTTAPRGTPPSGGGLHPPAEGSDPAAAAHEPNDDRAMRAGSGSGETPAGSGEAAADRRASGAKVWDS